MSGRNQHVTCGEARAATGSGPQTGAFTALGMAKLAPADRPHADHSAGVPPEHVVCAVHPSVPFTDLLSKVDTGQVESVGINEQGAIKGTLRDGT